MPLGISRPIDKKYVDDLSLKANSVQIGFSMSIFPNSKDIMIYVYVKY